MIIVNLILLCTVQIHNVLQTCTKCMKYKHSPNISVSFCCSVPANLVCVCVCVFVCIYIYIYIYTHTHIHTLPCYPVQLFSGRFLCLPPPPPCINWWPSLVIRHLAACDLSGGWPTFDPWGSTYYGSSFVH